MLLRAGGDPKRVCNLLTQAGAKIANEKGCGISELGVAAESLAELAKMVEESTVSATASVTIFEEMINSGKEPGVIAEEQNLVQKSDAGEIEALVDEAIAENEQAVNDVKNQTKKAKKAMGFLLGQVMQKSKGQANPKVVSQILNKKLCS